jgi:HrpA-like RNA helicase
MSASRKAKGASGGDAPAASAALPIAAFRDELVSQVARHTVTVVKSETGSGKSTQIPAYLLETGLLAHAVARGVGVAEAAAGVTGAAGARLPPVFIPPELWGSREPRIYVTQPRRVAAVTLAQRVAAERGTTVGGIVGYRIGHDAVATAATRVTFCTTGWLLQWLVAASAAADDEAVGTATHIVLDEVHERAIDVDLVCLVIKLALQRALAARARAIAAAEAAARAPAGSPGAKAAADAAAAALAAYASRPRLVLMSATFDTSIFSDYLAPLAASVGAALPAGSPLGGLQLAKLLPSLTVAAAGGVALRPPPLAVGGTLAELLRDDLPPTLHVGAKRYPVSAVWLESVYADPALKAAGLARSEAQQVGAAVAAFDKAAVTWRAKLGADGRAPPGGVADSVTLSDQAQSAVLRLAARLAIAASRPGSGDCILVFVPGLADIDKVCQAFLEVAPGKVAAPPSKLTSAGATAGAAAGAGEDDACDDDDLLAAGGGGGGGGAGNRRAAVPLVDDDDEDEEDDSESDSGEEGGATPAPSRATAPPAATAVPPPDGRSTIRLIPMHSLLSFEDQMAAFHPGAGDTRTRVVIATNIAESSVTLPDVHTVIDFGRAKTIEYVPKLNAPALRTTWISQASAAQRAGRAGRLMPGTVYRMYTRSFHDGVMPK